jgi:hypothetical protein
MYKAIRARILAKDDKEYDNNSSSKLYLSTELLGKSRAKYIRVNLERFKWSGPERGVERSSLVSEEYVRLIINKDMYLRVIQNSNRSGIDRILCRQIQYMLEWFVGSV